MSTEVRTCEKHGETNHYLDKSRNFFKCNKCNSEAVKKCREKLKVLAVEYKGGKCERCGYSKYIGALEFHHLNPSEKDFAISGSGNTRSFDKMIPELDKCIMLCANCHREEHGLS